MTTIIVLTMTILMIRIYIRSLLRSKSKNIKAQAELLASIRENAKQGVPIGVLQKSVIFAGTILALSYIVFFTVSAIIIGENWAGVAAAIFSVLSARQVLVAIEILKTETIKLPSIFDKFAVILGLVYSVYFLLYYSTLKFPEQATALLAGIAVTSIILLAFKKTKKPVTK